VRPEEPEKRQSGGDNHAGTKIQIEVDETKTPMQNMKAKSPFKTRRRTFVGIKVKDNAHYRRRYQEIDTAKLLDICGTAMLCLDVGLYGGRIRYVTPAG